MSDEYPNRKGGSHSDRAVTKAPFKLPPKWMTMVVSVVIAGVVAYMLTAR